MFAPILPSPTMPICTSLSLLGVDLRGAQVSRWQRNRFPVMSSDPHFGLTGLATMGANLARNVAHHDIPVAVHNRTTHRMETFIEAHGSEGPLTGHGSVEDWVGSLARPRVVMSMVQAG